MRTERDATTAHTPDAPRFNSAVALVVLLLPPSAAFKNLADIAMFLRTSRFRRRLTRLAAAILIGCSLGISVPGWSQGITLTGADEGGALILPPGVLTTNLTVTATPASPAGTTNVVFALEYQGSVIVNRTSPPPYSVIFSNLTAGKYFLSASLAGAGALPYGSLSFDIQAASIRPANDDWSQATVLAGLNATVTSSNLFATSEINEPTHGGLGIGKSLWWSWTAVSNGVFTATTAGSGFDTVLAVYTGADLNSLAAVGANDDAGTNSFSQATFTASSGTKYYFAVDGASAGAAGEARLRLIAGAPPTITIATPTNGALFFVSLPTQTTNATAAVAIADPSGIARVDYWFDGGPGIARSGVLASPYQLSLTNLLPGHYVLTVAASNNVGLVALTNTGFSVLPLAPVLVTDGFIPTPGQFQFAVMGLKGPNYRLEVSTNLEVWCSVSNWTNFAGVEKVADTNVSQLNRRFYRAASSQ